MTKARDLANSAAAFASVSATELGYVDGVTSAIQTQMDAKAPSSTAVTLTGTQTLTNKTLTSPALTTPTISTATTNGDILYGTGSGALSRLGIGSTNQALGVTGGVPAYQASSKSTLTTTGDTIYASAANTPARLGIGSTGQVLTVAAGLPSWATTASGGMTLIASGTLSGTSVSMTSIPATYNNLIIFVRNWYNSGGVNDLVLGVNSNNVSMSIEQQNNAGTYQVQTQTQHYVVFNTPTSAQNAHAYIVIPDYPNASGNTALAQSWAYVKASNTTQSHRVVSSAFPLTTVAITSVQLSCPASFGNGTYELWGQK